MSKRANGEGSIYKTKDGKWKVAVSVGCGKGGKRIRRYRTCRSKADAVAVLREAATVSIDATTATVGDCLDRWLEDVVRHESAINTRVSYAAAIRNHLKPRIGSIRADRLSSLNVQTMLAVMIEEEVGTRTRQLAFAVLSACMEYLFRMRAIRENPCKRVARPRYERKQIKPFTAEEIQAIFQHFEGTRWYALMFLAAHTGMRQGEILGMHWEQVNTKAGILTVDRQAIEVSGKTSIAKTKTKASIRRISLGQEVLDALTAHKAILLPLKLVGCPLVFPSDAGTIISKTNFIKKVWNPIFKVRAAETEDNPKSALPVEHRGFHHLRHSYASLSLGARTPIHVVAQILGHSSPSVTHNVYSHCLPADQVEAAESISRILAGGCPVAASEQRKSS